MLTALLLSAPVRSLAAGDITVTPVPVDASVPHLAWRVDLGHPYSNPFDPSIITVDARFTGPQAESVTVPGFWSVSADAPGGAFFVRFHPPTPGRWSMVVTAVDAAGSRASAPVAFDAAAVDRGSLIRVAPNQRYFEFDDGRPYFPIGLNLAWPPDHQRADWYDRMFAKLAAQGGNFARLWMADPKLMLESDRSGVGRYDLANAEFFDRVLASAERHDIRVMLCFLNHRELLDHDMWGQGGWPTSVFNARNGGPATQPVDFFTHDGAIRQLKARLRYIVARYAAFDSVGFWELFNEQEGALLPIPAAWDLDLAGYLRRIDPYPHLVTTSSILPDAVWQSPLIGLTQSHVYGNGSTVDLITPVTRLQAEFERFHKPHLFAEFGIDFHKGDYSFDPSGKATAFHNALWSAALSGSAGSAIYWWWDNYIDPKNLWPQFRPLANFTQSIDWAKRSFAPVSLDVHRTTADPPFVDLTLPAAGGWGDVAKAPVPIPANGRLDRPLPRFLCGPAHKAEFQPLALAVDLPRPSQLVINANRVSAYAVLGIFVDGQPFAAHVFTAWPGSPDTSDPTLDPQTQLYRAAISRPYRVASLLPAGRHTVTLQLLAGDWLTLQSVTFTHALDGRYANLGAVGLCDPQTSETLAWLFDDRSNWKLDQTQDPSPQVGIRLTLPALHPGTFSAEWWDTRTGVIRRTDPLTSIGQPLTITVPDFLRDIAVRIRPIDAPTPRP